MHMSMLCNLHCVVVVVVYSDDFSSVPCVCVCGVAPPLFPVLMVARSWLRSDSKEGGVTHYVAIPF